jgi:hypothetical protein
MYFSGYLVKFYSAQKLGALDEIRALQERNHRRLYSSLVW